MKTTVLNSIELEAVLGGDFAYDVGRLVRFFYLSGGGWYVGSALGDWAATTVMNEAQANK